MIFLYLLILFTTWKVYLDPVGLLAQLVECCTGIAKVMVMGHGFKSRTGLNFFQALFQLLVQCS